jgi:hypothetical protein
VTWLIQQMNSSLKQFVIRRIALKSYFGNYKSPKECRRLALQEQRTNWYSGTADSHEGHVYRYIKH